MEYQEFLSQLKALNVEWYLTHESCIRSRKTPSTCPWLAFRDAGLKDPVVDVGNQEIWDAADMDEEHDVKIRRDLLEACGLSEVTA